MTQKITQVEDKTPCEAAIASAKDGNLVQVPEIYCKDLPELKTETEALISVAEVAEKFNQPDQAISLLQSLIDSAETIKSSSSKVSALSAIAEAYIKLNQPEQAVPLLQRAIDSAETISEKMSAYPGSIYQDVPYKADALKEIANVITKLNQPEQAVSLLQRLIDSTQTLNEDSPYKAGVLAAIAEAYVKLNQPDQAVSRYKSLSPTPRQLKIQTTKLIL